MNLAEITSAKKPIVLIMGILNPIAIELISLLSTQESNIILTDLRQAGIGEAVRRLPNYGKNVFFVEYSSLKRIAHTQIKRVNYIFHFMYHTIVGSNYPLGLNEKKLAITHQQYLTYVETLDLLQTLAIEKNAKYQLVLPAFLLQLTKLPGQFNLELLKHSQLLTQNNMQEHRLKARIAKIGEPIGPDIDLSIQSIPVHIIQNLTKKRLVIPGDGLTTLFLSPISQTAQLLTLSILTAKPNSSPILVHHTSTPSVLSFLHTANEILGKDLQFSFKQTPEYSEVLNRKEELFQLQNGLPLQEIGLEYPTPLEEAIIETINSIYKKEPSQQEEEPLPPPKPVQKPKKITVRSIIVNKMLPTLSFVYKMLIQTSFNPLVEERLRIAPLAIFFVKAILVMALAAVTTPLIIIGINFYHLKTLLKNIKTSPPRDAKLMEELANQLREYHSITNISVPKELLRIKAIQDFNYQNQRATTTIKLLDSYATVIAPIDNYIQSHDGDSIRPLVLKAQINPTYLSELWITTNEYQDELDFVPISATLKDLIESMPILFPVLPILMGEDSPIRIELEHSKTGTSVSFVATGLELTKDTPEKPQFYIKFTIPDSVFAGIPDLQTKGSMSEITQTIPYLTKEELLRLITNFANGIQAKQIQINTNHPALINYFGL